MVYLELFGTFFKIGLFTIGGGYAMLPMISGGRAGQGLDDGGGAGELHRRQ